jgi:hypothetical protein
MARAHPVVADQIEAIANVLGQIVLKELDKSFDSRYRAERRLALLDHFWCDLLAAFAHALAELRHQLDLIPDFVASAIITTRGDHGARSPISDAEIKTAVQCAWNLIKQIPFISKELSTVDEPLRAIRMLAVMICPARERHREVAQYCLRPLTGEVMTAITRQRLTEALPSDWLF